MVSIVTPAHGASMKVSPLPLSRRRMMSTGLFSLFPRNVPCSDIPRTPQGSAAESNDPSLVAMISILSSGPSTR